MKYSANKTYVCVEVVRQIENYKMPTKRKNEFIAIRQRFVK